MLQKFYQKYLLAYPKVVFAAILVVFVSLSFFATKLEIDASAQTLLLDGDKDLEFTREIGKKFTAPDFLIVTYTINDKNLLSEENLEKIKLLQDEINSLEPVDTITSILNVPLLQSPARPISEVVDGVKTITSQGVDKTLAKQEFLNSPIYKQNLVSDDFQTTTLLINIKRDTKYFELLKQNNPQKLKEYRDKLREKTHQFIVNIRSLLAEFEMKQGVQLHLGGAMMIADDMVEFVKYDLQTFSIVVVLLLIVILYILLKEIKWIFIPLFICMVSIVMTSGLLGLFGWEITVISSNFISLQLIMNMSLVIHLIIKYKELRNVYPDYSQKKLATQTAVQMAKPSFFVVITTIAGFSSLVYSGILPVINFGWMMSVGIIISLLLTFLLFPLVVSFFSKSKDHKKKQKGKVFTHKVALFALANKKTILFSSLIVVVFSMTGATQLKVENSFIDYFKKDTDIYKGMKLIDQKLGGTTPLDVVITFKNNSDEIESIQIEKTTNNDPQMDMLDEFADEFAMDEQDKSQYWFTQTKLDTIKKVHQYLDSLEPVGKVLSLATLLELGKTLNEGKDLDGVTLALMNNELPQKYKDIILSPYVDIDSNMARISTRIIDSMEGLERDKLLKQIDTKLQTMINPEFEEYRISNLLVIYNNMLQSLFDSQIKTIAVVVLILFIMFLVLFKSLKIAIVAIIVNSIPVSVIFGVMGWFDIPLDMMTITIAAISIGIAVDDTIHYIHRFNLEQKDHADIVLSIQNAHKSIGRAMFYTSTVIIVGFSVLVLSNFIPTIYFGLLTMLAMFMAILADLLLLPVLLVYLNLLFNRKSKPIDPHK
jgi:predicted RND superfamily exporter protein